MSCKNKMLIVDDDIITRNIAALIFKDNFEVVEAQNGLEALNMLNSYRSELAFILCDISMPVMDGFAFLNEKNKATYNKGIPVIIITSVGDDILRQQAISLGAADFVDKPLDPDIVCLRVNNVLSNYGIGYAYNDSLQREFLDLINTRLRGGTLSLYDLEDYPIYYISESLAVYLEYKNAAELIEALDGKWSNMFSSHEFLRIQKTIRAQLTEKGEFIHELRLRKKNGDYIWIRENGKYSHDPTSIKKIISLCVDITDIKNAEEKARYKEQLANIALKSTNMSIWEYDFKSKCIIQAQNSIAIHGLDNVISNVPESLIDSGYVHPDSAQAFLKIFEDLKNGAKNADGVFKMKHANGIGYWHEHVHYTNTFDKNGNPYRAIGISIDVTEQEATIARYQREIDLNKALSADIFSTARLNFTQNTIEEIHSDVAEDKALLANLILKNPLDFLKLLPCMEEKARKFFRSLTKAHIIKSCHGENSILSYEFLKEINNVPTWVRFELHLTEDPYNDDLLAFIYFRNINEQHRQVEQLKELVNRDQMTGLYNHEATIHLIKKHLSANEAGQNHALFVIDINKFKYINDTYGHMQGDHVLVETAKRIQDTFGSDDIVGRVGGDEFMVFMKNVPNRACIEAKAEELILATSFKSKTVENSIRCSIGIVFTHSINNFTELYQKADEAMYKAKQTPGIGYTIRET